MSPSFCGSVVQVTHTQEGRLQKVVLLAAVSLFIFGCAPASAQEWSWTTEKVARGLTSSIALDVDQNLHLTYLTRDTKVYYAFRIPESSKWFTTVVVESTHQTTNTYPRVTADNKGMPHLCVAFGELVYVTLKNRHWVSQKIDPGSGMLSYHCSVAVGPDGTPHLGWYHERLPNGQQYGHFRHAALENGVWVVRSVDGGISGKWNSMVTDSKGFPHASYSQFLSGDKTVGEVGYAEWNGSNWSVTIVESSQKGGFDNSLALSPDGSASISYFDGGALKYAHQSHGKWDIEKVDVVGSGYDVYAGSTTVLLDSHGNPHIVYGDFGAVKHAFWDGKKWQIETVVSGAAQQYENVDAAIGPKDTLYVSYPDPEDGFVKVATGRLASSAPVTKK